MPVSKQEDMMVNLQRQMQLNQAEMKDYLKDLDNWESDIKKKDDGLKKEKVEEEGKSDLPPVRNSLNKKKRTKKKSKEKSKTNGSTTPKRINSYDYRSWDKFDVDKALDDIEKTHSDSSSSYETDEEWEVERRKHRALLEKEKGNEYFKNGDFVKAIESYTMGIDLDPANAVLPANRAMALLKQEKYATAELDCSTALSLDPLYVKAYLRRATARVGLQKYVEGIEDYKKVLKLEPENKKAKAEVEKLKKEIAREKELPKQAETVETTDAGIVRPVYKPPELRSSKPLKRIEIEEIGVEEDDRKQKMVETESKQSETKRKLTSKDYESFEKFTGDKTSYSKDSKNKTSMNVSETNDKSLNRFEPIQEVMSSDSPHHQEEVSSKSVISRTNPSRPSDDKTNTNLVVENNSQLDVCKPVPQNSFQFQADYKCLKNDESSFYSYFKKIDPSNYPKLFGEYLDSDILMNVLKSFHKYCISAGEDIFDKMKFLSQVKRFSMVVMFLSSNEKKVIGEIFDYLYKSSSSTRSDIEKLGRLYGIKY